MRHGLVMEHRGKTERVGLGAEDDLKDGGRVAFYEQDCQEHLTGIGKEWRCERVKSGGGTVEQVLGPDTGLVRPDAGVTVRWSLSVRPDDDGFRPARF